MLKKILYWFHNKALKEALSKTQHAHKTVSLETAKTMCILFNAEDPANETVIKKLMTQLQQQGFKIEVMGYISKLPKNRGRVIFNYFTRKEVSWHLVPANNIIENFANTPFDILLNLYTEEILPLEYISAIAKSKFRIGRYIEKKNFYCDMMISLIEKDNLESLIQQIMHYLNKINTTTTSHA
jgi:hypothetical protein